MTDVMTATFVEAKRTPRSFEEVEPAMRWALKVQMGHEPSDGAVALGCAKTALETGRWQSMYNFDLGNIKAGTQYVGMYTAYECNEILQGHAVYFSPYGRLDKKGGVVVAEAYSAEPWHPQTRFRAYAGIWDGVSQYTDLISTGRYKVAWARLLSGDVTGFVHELKLAGYFTADEALYMQGVQGLYTEMLARVKKLPHEPAAQEHDWNAILATVRGDQFAHANFAQSGADVGSFSG